MPVEDSDDSLMNKAATGDPVAFDGIVRRHQHQLQRFATRMLGGDSARGADVAVGAFLRLWEKRTTFHAHGQSGAWLLKTAYHLCLDILACDRSKVDLDTEWPSPERIDSCVEKSALAQAIRDAVMELPMSHRAVIVLSVYEGLSYEEISQALDVSPGTVGSRKNHALTVLRRRLSAWDDSPLRQ
jgi:RNA polymerase sigma-70 factor (ECF subfamily)